MYKVKKENEDKNIIARFSERPLEPCEIELPTHDPKPLTEQWENLGTIFYDSAIPFLHRMAALYRFVDFYLEHKGVKKLSVCQRGCAHCCTMDVDVSLPEALYISYYTKDVVIDRQDRIRYGYHKEKYYCQFLNRETGECKIYPWRPLACRSYFTFDNPKYCDIDKGLTHSHSVVTAFTEELLLHLSNQLLSMGHGKFADVREWFVDHTSEPFTKICGTI